MKFLTSLRVHSPPLAAFLRFGDLRELLCEAANTPPLGAGKFISHFWGSELLYVPPEPGQEYRHNDALDALWNMLDLTPAGRGDFHPQLSYPTINPKGSMT